MKNWIVSLNSKEENGLIKINVRLFATLRKYVPNYDPEQGMNVEMNEGSTVKDLVHLLHLSQSEAKIIVVNGVPKKTADLIHDGDQVNIFTPITGG